ncbi:MAG: sulfite exporter TauE/SafE family protein [Chloroflexi bacterium]|nr:sulfite exporter TauE/SafE family protein [Chloroflexota bacterium]MBV9602913.1 sulfite exporter TauE/SafE family protein [Chloroflexota bacterium]
MLSEPLVYVVALVAAFVIATLASPVGVSGAVLLLPFQVSVLGTPSPAVTPTNLLYNTVATPGALYRYWRQNQTGGALTRVLLAGTIPGVVAGAIVRVELLPDPRAFQAVIAIVLIPLGAWILVGRRSGPIRLRAAHINSVVLAVIAALVGCVGGIYGIGGGSLLAPILIGSGRSPSEVAPATLASTFVTSVAGVITFVLLSVEHQGMVAPDWGIGLALGVGGLVGGYTGALLQPHLPEIAIRRLLGLLVLAIGIRYAWLAWSE